VEITGESAYVWFYKALQVLARRRGQQVNLSIVVDLSYRTILIPAAAICTEL
jgi:hypothetical protein